MELPTPNHRKDKTIDEHFVRLFKEVKPDFQQEPTASLTGCKKPNAI